MEKVQELRRRVRAAQVRVIAAAARESLGLGILVFAAVIGAGAGIEAVAGLEVEARRFVWASGALAALLVGAWRWRKEAVGARAAALRLGRGRQPEDEFLTAWELISRAGTDPFVDRALDNLRWPQQSLRSDAGEGGRRRGRFVGLALAGLAALAVAAGGRRAFWPFGPDRLPGLLSLEPGDADVPRGTDVAIVLKFAGAPAETPVLWTKSAGAVLTPLIFTAAGDKRYQATLPSLREEIQYRVKVNARRSKKFRLRPFDPPRLTSFRAEIRPPSYAGHPVERAANPFAPAALPGAVIVFSGAWEGAGVRARVSDGEGGLATLTAEGERFRWTHAARGPAHLKLWAADAKAPNAAPAAVADIVIEALTDRPPEIRWLEPAVDLRVSPTEEIPVAYEVADDFGADGVSVEFSVNGGPLRRERWRRFSPGENTTDPPLLVEGRWALAPLGVKAGDRVEARLAARDRNPAGAEGRSETRRFQVASYEEDHREVVEALESFQRTLLDRLAEQIDIEDGAAGAEADRAAFADREAGLGRKLEEDARALASTIDRMAVDPFTDLAVLDEHRAVEENLRDLAGQTVPEAARALREGNRAGLAAVTSELERLSVLAERALQAQNTRRLLADQSDLTRQAGKIEEVLARRIPGALSAEDQAALGEALRRMEETLTRIARQIQDLPKSLAEDFLNQPGVKTLRFDEVRSRLGDLGSALARGDAAGALAAARSALEALREMERTLQSAGRNALGSELGGADPALERALQVLGERLKDLIRRQEAVLGETVAVQSRWLQAQMRRQESALAGLRERVPQWRGGADLLEGRLRPLAAAAPSDEPGRPLAAAVLGVRTRLFDLDRALGTDPPTSVPARLAETAEALRHFAVRVEETRRGLFPDKWVPGKGPGGAQTAEREKNYNEWKRLEESAAGLAAQAAEVLHALGVRADVAADLASEDAARVERLAAEEGRLSGETREFASELADPARRTALLGGRLFRRFAEAAAAMDEAVERLGRRRISPAVESEERALDLLRENDQELSQAGQSLARRGSSGAGPAAPTLQRSAGPATGSAAGRVRLPRAGDFHPPAEFREELSESMKERYPNSYERLIQDYFHHWSK